MSIVQGLLQARGVGRLCHAEAEVRKHIKLSPGCLGRRKAVEHVLSTALAVKAGLIIHPFDARSVSWATFSLRRKPDLWRGYKDGLIHCCFPLQPPLTKRKVEGLCFCGRSTKAAQHFVKLMAERPATNMLLPRLRAAWCGRGGPDSGGQGASFHAHPWHQQTELRHLGRLLPRSLAMPAFKDSEITCVRLWCVHRVR